MHTCQKLVSRVEFVAGVPASVGGMIAMNFGCWGREIAHYLESIKVINQSGDANTLKKKTVTFLTDQVA